MAFHIPPTPTYKRDIEELEKYYKKALKQITSMLVATDPEDLLRVEIYESITRQLTFIINDLNAKSKAWIESTLMDAFEHSQAQALVTMGLAKDIVEAKGKLQFSLLSRKRIEAMIEDTFEDVLKAHSKMSTDMKKLVREVQAEVLRVNTALQRGTVTSAKDLKTALMKEGFSKSLVEENWKGIVDAGGNRWDLTTYTRMVARTKLQQVQIEGARLTALENDTDLAIISSHGAKDACRSFEGMIISLEGRTKGYMTLADVRNSGLIFHPNCQHSVHPIGDVKALPEKLKEKANKAERSAEKALEDPKALKREDNQRRYEEKKQLKEELKRKRKEALEKARKAREAKREQQ
jgi:hypothetical protein